MKTLHEEELAVLLEKAATRGGEIGANRVLQQLSASLGVDLTDNENLRALKSDLAYLHVQHEGSDELRRLMKDSAAKIVTAGLIGIAAWFLLAFRQGLHDYFVGWLK